MYQLKCTIEKTFATKYLINIFQRMAKVTTIIYFFKKASELRFTKATKML